MLHIRKSETSLELKTIKTQVYFVILKISIGAAGADRFNEHLHLLRFVLAQTDDENYCDNVAQFRARVSTKLTKTLGR